MHEYMCVSIFFTHPFTISAVANASLVYPINFAPPKAATEVNKRGVEKVFAVVSNVSATEVSA